MSWGHVGVQRQYACQAVYADHKVDNVEDINITSVTTTHYYTVITFEHLGKTVKFISVHIQAGADIPAQFTELVNAFTNDEYVIITGDFNIVDMSHLSVFTNAGYTLANGGAWGNIETFTRTKSSDGYCLDNIVSKGFYMTDVKTFPFELSDHYPFVCRLMLKQN
jgi:endonuclease/exonuclease/phosphatase family metal-dependent hydrolase